MTPSPHQLYLFQPNEGDGDLKSPKSESLASCCVTLGRFLMPLGLNF